MNKPTVLLKKSRDFSDVINATFAFISQEFRNYGKVILYYAGIPILLSAIATAFFSGSEISKVFSQMGNMNASMEILGASYYLTMALVNILSLVVYVFVSGLTAAYLDLYTRKGRNGFEIHEVWQCFTSSMGRLLGFYLVVFFGFMLLGGVISMMFFSFSLLGAGGAAAVIMVFLGMLLFFVFAVYVSVPLSMGYLIIYAEDKSFGALFKRAFELVKGSWWQSFGVVFILIIIFSLVSSLFSIPVIISSAMQGFLTATGGDPIGGENLTFAMIIVSLISTLGQFLMYPIFLIGVGFQYYNLREQKDNEGLLDKVAEMAE